MMTCLMYVTVLTVIVLMTCPSFTLTYCPKGTYMFKPERRKEVCDYCPSGTFMPYDDHTYKECFNCTQIVNSTLEVLKEECTRTQDSKIQCVHGYYRRLPMNIREKERCEKCTECTHGHMTVACQGYTDSHCCMEEHYVVSPDHNGVNLCWETPWLCRRGQYFDTPAYDCLPCPDGTFMDLDYHIMTECWPCPTLSKIYHIPKHGVIVQQCNKTHPPLVECHNGFYIKYDLGFNNDYIGCSQCKTCNETGGMYEARKCNRLHDTVCCRQPNMTVLDTTEGPECRDVDSGANITTGVIKPYPNITEEVSDFTEDNESLSAGEIVSIVVAVFIVVVIVVIIFVVLHYRLWPFKRRNQENQVEDGTEMDERKPLLEDKGGQHSSKDRQEIIIRNVQKSSRDPPQLTYMPLFELSEPKLYTFEGCVTILRDGDLSFYIGLDGDDAHAKSMLSTWYVSVLGKTGRQTKSTEKTMSLDKFTSPEEDRDLNDGNSVIVRNDQLRDEGLQLPDVIRVTWDVKVEMADDNSQKLLVTCRISPV